MVIWLKINQYNSKNLLYLIFAVLKNKTEAGGVLLVNLCILHTKTESKIIVT